MLLMLNNQYFINSIYGKENVLLNSNMLTDDNEDGKADNWSFVLNGSHSGVWSINGGQLLTLTESGEAAAASYFYQSGSVGAGVNVNSEVVVKTEGSLNIHVQMRYKQGGSNIDSVVTGYSSYPNWTKIKLNGTTPENTDNVALFIFLYNTSLATGVFYAKNGKVLI